MTKSITPNNLNNKKEHSLLLGLDYGKKYIGCAYAYTSHPTAIALPVIIYKKYKEAFGKIDLLIKQLEKKFRCSIKKIVIGMPKQNIEIEYESSIMKSIVSFKKYLENIYNESISIVLSDESYSSAYAKNIIQLTNGKDIDSHSIAATNILEEYIKKYIGQNQIE